jgi:RNA-binding protein
MAREQGQIDAATEAVRRCGAVAGDAVAIHLTDGGLEECVREVLAARGIEISAGGANFGIADGCTDDDPLVPEAIRELMTRLSPEGRLAVIIHGTGLPPEGPDETWLGRVLHSKHAVLTRVGALWVASAARRGVPSSRRRKELRGMGHAIEASVLLGREGLTRDVLKALHAALERHGLVKLKLTPQCEMDKEEAARTAALATGSVLVQRVGRTALLLRQGVPCNPPVARKGKGRQRGPRSR